MKKTPLFLLAEEKVYLGLPEEAKQHLIEACRKKEPLALYPLLQIYAFENNWKEIISAFNSYANIVMKITKNRDGTFDMVFYNAIFSLVNLALRKLKSTEKIVEDFKARENLPSTGFRMFSVPKIVDPVATGLRDGEVRDDPEKHAEYLDFSEHVLDHMPPYDRKDPKKIPSYRFLIAQHRGQELAALEMYMKDDFPKDSRNSDRVTYIARLLIRQGKIEEARQVVIDWSKWFLGALYGQLLPEELLYDASLAAVMDEATCRAIMKVSREGMAQKPKPVKTSKAPVPKLSLSLKKSSRAITDPVTKFGGQPVWLESPQWPVSASTGKPLSFIGQVKLEPTVFGKISSKMAYIFMNQDENIVETSEPDGGENAIILQPSGKMNANIKVISETTGPTFGEDLVATLKEGSDRFYVNQDDLEDEISDKLQTNKIGGMPYLIQGSPFPDPWQNEWNLLIQLDEIETLPNINFGTGTGYGFISKDGTRGKFFWQC